MEAHSKIEFVSDGLSLKELQMNFLKFNCTLNNKSKILNFSKF